MTSIHKFKIEGIDGKIIDFSDFKGKKIMIVNVASECGFTPQYQQLQELYETMSDKVIVVGVPSNDFGGQEPGENDEIKAFCELRYGVTFPLTAKIAILNTPHPIYQWLTSKDQNGKMDSEVKWNFHKFLIDEKGHLFDSILSAQSPISEEILNWVSS